MVFGGETVSVRRLLMKFEKIVFFFAVTLFAIYLKAGTWNDLETGIIWYYSEDSNGNLEITNAKNAYGEVIVPSVIEGKNVISIGWRAFHENTTISKIVISKGILSVGSAFNKSSINEVVFSEGFESIGGGAFRHCHSLQKVVMPNSITYIGSGAFHNCTALKELIIPSGVKTIEAETFLNCKSLVNLVIPNSVTEIKTSAPYPDPFQGCDSLVCMTVPECLCKFANKIPSSLTNIVFAEGVKVIEGRSFEHRSQLKSISLPDSLETIEGSAFLGCRIESLTLPNGLKLIGANAFQENPLKDIVIPNSVTNIGSKAFYYCENLSEVLLPNNIERVALDAFDCTPVGFRIESNLVKMALVQNNNENADSSYSLTDSIVNRSIVNVKVNKDSAIDSFVLKDGKVFDCALRIVNTSDKVVNISLPVGYVYEKFSNTKPLEIPALSTNILTITRTDEKTFLIAREELTVEGK
jgi:hypothetical protein